MVLEPDRSPGQAGAGAVDRIVLAPVELVSRVQAHPAPAGAEVLGHHREIAVEKSVSTFGDVRIDVVPSLSAGGGVADPHDQGGHPSQAEFPLFQQLETAGEMTVLVEHDFVTGRGIGFALAVEDRTDIAELQPAPESDGEAVLEGVVAPGGGGQGMLVQIVVGDHERPVRLHLGRGHLQEPGAAVGELRAGGPGRQSHKQEE